MSPGRTLAIAERIIRQIVKDRRSAALIIVAPLIVMSLVGFSLIDQKPILNRVAPGLLGTFVMFFTFLLTGVSFLRERAQGTLERLMTTTVARGDITGGLPVGVPSVRHDPGGGDTDLHHSCASDRVPGEHNRDRRGAAAAGGGGCESRNLRIDLCQQRVSGRAVHPHRAAASDIPVWRDNTDGPDAVCHGGHLRCSSADLRRRGPSRDHGNGPESSRRMGRPGDSGRFRIGAANRGARHPASDVTLAQLGIVDIGFSTT